VQLIFFRFEGETMKPKGLKPGQIAPASGEYQIRGPRGGHGQERTVIQGEPLPSTPGPKQTYDLVRPARNGAGKPR
jgi:hypothetical protein